MSSFVVAKALVVNENNEVLAIRRSQTDDRRPGQWDFPGGWVEEGEDVYAAVVREIEEEVGLKADNPELVFAFSEMTTQYGSGSWIFFIVRVKGQPAVTLSYEHDLAAWKQLDELIQEVQYDRQLKLLNYVRDNHLLESDQS